jgi:exonuclease III
MATNFNCLVWNVHGLNSRACRNVVWECLVCHKPSLVCLQDTKLSGIYNTLALELLGPSFDYVFLASVGSAGGVLLAWRCDFWAVSDVSRGLHSLNAKISGSSLATPWWITVVYRLQSDTDKVAFLAELRQFGATVSGPWMLCGDFNMVYRAQDKNNDRMDRHCMRRFRAFLNQARLDEIFLVGRKYTWSNEREQPTLVLLDRVFVMAD